MLKSRGDIWGLCCHRGREKAAVPPDSSKRILMVKDVG